MRFTALIQQLECVGLSIRRGGRPVLRDVDLMLHCRECLSLIGPNGSGKTTLLLALLGLLRPAAGGVRLDGAWMHRLSARRRGRFAAYVPQVVERLSGFRVYDVVAGGRYPHLSPLRPLSDLDRQAVERALAETGLSELAERPVDAISGGERQKALIAAALVQDAEMMFLDEPTTALDPAVQVELARLLRRWQARGRGLLVVSHDLHLPLALGGRVVALREGRVAANGAAEEVLRPERLAAVYGAEFELACTPGGQQFVVPCWPRSSDAI